MKERVSLIMALLLVGLSTITAQQAVYQSKLLVEIGKRIGYVPIDTLAEGTYDVGIIDGMPIIARYDNRHTVRNLGVRLFAPQVMNNHASDVYDFLERYFLELVAWKDKVTLEQKMADDKVMLVIGTLDSLRLITDRTPFTISRFENRFYEVSWLRENGSKILVMVFPIQYELLFGMPQVEIANTMYDRIVSAPKFSDVIVPDSLQSMDKYIYRSVPIRSYQIEDVNNALYFFNDNDEYSLVVDTAMVNYSATNALQQPTRCDNPINVEQSVYGFKKLHYTITLSQWINYCHSAGLETYTAIEEEYDDAIRVLMVAESKDFAYNHLLSFIIPRNFIAKPNAEFKCKLSAFIPTHNVKNLYQQYVEKPKKEYR